MEKLSLETLMQGAVQEKFENELKRVLENIMDPNTDFKKKRKLFLILNLLRMRKETKLCLIAL